jgi:hypothetical protein
LSANPATLPDTFFNAVVALLVSLATCINCEKKLDRLTPAKPMAAANVRICACMERKALFTLFVPFLKFSVRRFIAMLNDNFPAISIII